jgi:hypothetical protein
VRGLIAATVAFAIVASTIAPASADSQLPTGDPAKALALMNASCGQVAELQVQASPAPSSVPSPAPADTSSPAPAAAPSAQPSNGPVATPPPLPHAPTGPQQLLPPPLPNLSPTPAPPPVPTPTPRAQASQGPVLVERIRSAGASPAPSAEPSPAETLQPNTYIVLADSFTGVNTPGEPADADGSVNVFYQDGILVGDHAHYDGTRYIDVTGRPYLRNREDDSILNADAIRFDTRTQRAILVNGRGSTTQGVEKGKLYFKGRSLTTTSDGHTHGDRASFTTCERQRAGYHIESKTLDIFPGDKAIAKDAILYLGGFAVLFLPVVVIPLTQNALGGRQNQSLVPVIGYSEAEGFYVKAKIGFAPSDTYYGYYRVDAYTKLGLGLGYVAFFRKKNGKRAADVNFYRFKSKQDGSQQNNFALNDSEIFSNKLKAQLGVNYTGNYGPYVSLPPSYAITGTVQHTGTKESQTYTFNRNSTGSTQTSDNYGFVDQRTISPAITQGINVSLSDNSNAYAGQATVISTLHLNSLTHLATKGLSFDLTFDRTNSDTPYGIEKLPELMVRPNGTLDPNFKLLPITGTFTIGDYTEPQTPLTTQRAEALFNIGPVAEHFFGSDLNAGLVVRQDAYGTGDLKAQIQQNASFTTPITSHIVNAITYSEQNSNGPQAEPFQSLDVYGGGSHQASDVIRFFNGNIYTISLQTNTLFDRSAQPIAYQASFQPSPRSSIQLGGSYIPGPGQGFPSTNLQLITPFGRGSDIQFATNIDWKNKGRLENKTIFYRRVIGDCYEILTSYNQELKQVTFQIEILAFPSHAASFGLGSSTSITPGSLNFANQ